MDTLPKRGSESLLEKVTQELTPDIPTHNKFTRSWQEYEKAQLHKSRSLKKEMDQIRLKIARSSKALVAREAAGLGGQAFATVDGGDGRNSCLHWKDGMSSDFHANGIPGFRYRANGDKRQPTGQGSLRSRTEKPVPGTSKHSINVNKRGINSGTGKLSYNKSTSDNVIRNDVFDDDTEYEPDVGGGLKANKNSTRLQEEETAHFRIRKVQEQLGLTRRPSQQHMRSANPMEASLEMEHLNHALKVLGFVLRDGDGKASEGEEMGTAITMLAREKDTDMDTSAKNTPMRMSKTSLSAFKPTVEYLSVDSRKEVGLVPGGPTRERCEACRHHYQSDMNDLVRQSNPEIFMKPRWKLSPSGRYVPPPLKSLKFSHPALYNRAEELGKFQSHGTSSKPTPPAERAGREERNSTSDSILSVLAARNSFSESNASVDVGDSGGSEKGSVAVCAARTAPVSRRVSLDALKEKNNVEVQLVQKKMCEFLNTIQTSRDLHPAKSAMTPSQMIERHKFSGF